VRVLVVACFLLPFVTVTPSCSGPNPPRATATGVQLVTNSWSPTSHTDPRFNADARAVFASLQWHAAVALALVLTGLVLGVALPERSTARLIVYLVGGYAVVGLTAGSPSWDVGAGIGLQVAWLGCAVTSSEAFGRIVQHRSPTPLPTGLTAAPLRKRLAAWLIDVVIVAALAALILTTVHPPSPELIVLLLAGAYWIGQHAYRGATLGQHALGIRTAHASGDGLSLPRAALRSAAWPVSALFWLGLGSIVTLRLTGRTLQDLLTNTRVLDNPPPSPPHVDV
jgi:uncharacterized RDD family membrane protein YckC